VAAWSGLTMSSMNRIRMAVVLALLGVVAGVCGCQKPIFAENKPRTPYERFQVLRGERRPVTEPNVYGVDQPALRQRLEPLEH